MTPQLADVIRAAIFDYMTTIHTAIPAEVVKYDAATKKVDAHPLIKIAFSDSPAVSAPTVSSVPVMFPGSSSAVLQFPLVKGDSGLLICSEKSLENWLVGSGGEASPGDTRHFSMTDAVFIPGLFPFGAPGQVGNQKDGLELNYKGVEIQIDKDGNVNIAGSSKSFVTYDELNSALITFMSALVTALTTTPIAGSGTPQPIWTGLPTSIDISAAKTQHIKTGG